MGELKVKESFLVEREVRISGKTNQFVPLEILSPIPSPHL